MFVPCSSCSELGYRNGTIPICQACSPTGRILGQFDREDGRPKWCALRPENRAKCKRPNFFRRVLYRRIDKGERK